MQFRTDVVVHGPYRYPAQMLAEQVHDGHLSLHSEGEAATLGLAGAPIEGPTHFSQIDPLGVLVWGDDWFSRGCISAHFRQMVIEGEAVQATLATAHDAPARIELHKQDGTPVLTGTASIGPGYGQTELEARRARPGGRGDLYILDQLEVGMNREAAVSMSFDEPNGALYPFSLADKLSRITEPHPWYVPETATRSPWGRPIVPMEMISVLGQTIGLGWPVRTPAIGLFLDLEVRLLAGPVFVGEQYSLRAEIVGVSHGRRTESYWTQASLTNQAGEEVTRSLLHLGFFKESYPGYPADRLAAGPGPARPGGTSTILPAT
jgi:hypothetical protein